jgi:hypothetical protein
LIGNSFRIFFFLGLQIHTELKGKPQSLPNSQVSKEEVILFLKKRRKKKEKEGKRKVRN